MIRVLAFILICNIALAQKTESRNNSYAIDEIKAQSYSFPAFEFPDNEKQITAYLIQKISTLSSLKLLYIKKSPGGKHYCFQQSINGIDVYRSQIKVNVLKNKKAVSVFALVFSADLLSSENFSDAHNAELFIQNHRDVSKSKITKIYYFYQSKLIPAYLIYIEKKGCLSYEYIIDNSGDIVYSNDLLSYSGKKDSTAVFNFFNPDPITSAQTFYGAPYNDRDDSDDTALHNELKQKTLSVKFQNDTFYLENDYYKIVDIDIPNNIIVTSKTDSFNFNRSQIGFEEANSFYHINTYRNHLKTLGFNNIVDFPLWIDAHAHDKQDNSSFNEFSAPVSLLFGDGGVDDAEDADVVVHEFGHAISAAAAPQSNVGAERQAIDEGFCDYIAVSYSRSINEYNWQDVFNWDGHNEFWKGRTAVSTKHYPDNLIHSKWLDGEMWSSTLMQIHSDIGANTTDSIVFQALYAQTQNTTMPDAAQLIMDADSALFNGKYYSVLHSRMAARGFFQQPDTIPTFLTDQEIQVFNSYSFIHGGALTIAFNARKDATLELYDISGRLIEKSIYTNIAQTTYSSDNISSGAYFLKISTTSKTLAVKLLRY